MSSKMAVPTTAIRVLGETWHVPRGFGRAYARQARADLENIARGRPGETLATVTDLLALVGFSVATEQVAAWDLRRRVEAVVHASNVHARASDNPVPRHPRPSWLPERPWQGTPGGSTGTPLEEGV